jgi:opacity protein-like surface antigen
MKTTKSKILASTVALFSGDALAGDVAPTPRSFDLVPYVWVAGVSTEMILPNLPPSTPSGVERFDTSISAGAMVTGQVRYGSVGVALDFAWLRLNTSALNAGPAYSAVDLESNYIHTTAALTYELPLHGRFHVDLLAGARLWNVAAELDFKRGLLPGFKQSIEKTWVDPIVGTALRYDLAPRWGLLTKGTVGGSEGVSEIAWELFGGVNYHFTEACTGTLGYRYLHEEYDQSGFGLNLDASGFLLGLGFHF